MKFGFSNMLQGLAGNMSAVDKQDLESKYGEYLLERETIESGFKLVRDTIIFTDIRILFIDHQGTTGRKTSFKSIFLSQIVNVEMETAGFGIDDSELEITYLENVYLKPRSEKLLTQKFEFPKKTEITSLYRNLLEIAVANRERINS